MIRTLERRAFAGNLLLCRFVGNSGDTKPTEGIVTGSTFTEADTGIDYVFDEVSGGWVAQNTGNGKTSIAGATVTLGSAVSYDGTEKTKSVSSVKIGSTTLTVTTDYVVEGNKATEPGNYTLRVKGVGDYCGYVDADWTLAKGTGAAVADPYELSLTEDGEAGTSTLTVVGDGEISVTTSAADVATATVEDDTVTVTPVGAGEATITVTISETAHYTGGTDTISVTVAAAENDGE